MNESIDDALARLNAQLLPGQPAITAAELEAWRALDPDVVRAFARELPYMRQLISDVGEVHLA